MYNVISDILMKSVEEEISINDKNAEFISNSEDNFKFNENDDLSISIKNRAK